MSLWEERDPRLSTGKPWDESDTSTNQRSGLTNCYHKQGDGEASDCPWGLLKEPCLLRTLIWNFCLPELRGNTLLLFIAVRFLQLCYGNPRKWIWVMLEPRRAQEAGLRLKVRLAFSRKVTGNCFIFFIIWDFTEHPQLTQCETWVIFVGATQKIIYDQLQ